MVITSTAMELMIDMNSTKTAGRTYRRGATNTAVMDATMILKHTKLGIATVASDKFI
jgi:hypothetical protein